MHANKHIVGKVAIFAGLFCLVVFGRALFCDFVNFEDPDYVLNNPVIRKLDSDFWSWAFTTVPLNFWVPLLWVSFALDYYFWGLNPFGYHLTNNILHAVNTGLVVLIADKVYQNSSVKFEAFSAAKYLYPTLLLLAALLYGIHPARVESVAWITERKDVLNGVFTFASIYFYLRYVEKKRCAAAKIAVRRAYACSLGLFLVSLTAKPGSIFVPVALLVIDWYPLGRFAAEKKLQLIAEKVPFILLATPIIAASVIGRAMQGGYNSLEQLPFTIRLVAAGNSLLEYGSLMLFPVGVLPYHHLPRPIPNYYILKAVVAYAALVLIFFLARKKYPWLVAIIFSFIVTLFPALHFFADGYQVQLAPRYTYLASLFPAILVAALLVKAYQRMIVWHKAAARAVALLVVALLLFYAGMTPHLIADWQDSGTLWTKVINRQPFEKAYFFRGQFQAEKGNYLAAIEDYSTCITLSAGIPIPTMFNVYAYRGEALMKAGYVMDALDDFNLAIALNPQPIYFYYRGLLLRELGRNLDAEEDFRRAGQAAGPLYWIE